MAFKSQFFQQGQQKKSDGASGLTAAVAKEPVSTYKWQRTTSSAPVAGTTKATTLPSKTATTRTPTGMSRGSQSSTDNNGNYVNQKRVYGGAFPNPAAARANYAARSGIRQNTTDSSLALSYLKANGMSENLAGLSAQQVRDQMASAKDDDQREQMRTYAQWLEDQGDKITLTNANASIGAGKQKLAKATPSLNWSNPNQQQKMQNLQHQQTVLSEDARDLNKKGESLTDMEARLKKIADAYNAHPTKLLADRYNALYTSYQQTAQNAQAQKKDYDTVFKAYKADSRDYATQYDDATRYNGMNYDAISEYAAKLQNQAARTDDPAEKKKILQERDRAINYRNTLGTPEQLKNTEAALKAERINALKESTAISAASTKTDANQTIREAAASQAKLDRINADLRVVQKGKTQAQNKVDAQKFINYAAGNRTEKLPDVKVAMTDSSYINYLINGKNAIKPSPELQFEASKIEKSISLLPENERKAMQYYINQGDVKNAAKFYATIKDEAEQLYSTSEAESAYKWAGKNFPNALMATAGSGIIGAVGTQSGWLDNLISTIKNTVVDNLGVGNYRFSDTNGDAYLGSRVSGAMQEGVQSYNNRTFGEGTGGAQVANTIAGATTSAIENVVQYILFGEKLTLPLMALGAGGQSTYETLRQGGSVEDAALTGTIDGAVEYLTEVIPFDMLLDKLDVIGKGGGTMSVADIAKMVRSQGLEEANEEVVGNIAENLYDMAYHKDQSDVWQYVAQLKEMGYSEEDARKEAYGKYFIGDSIEAGVSAYLSSAMMLGGNFVGAKAQNTRDTRMLGQAVKTMAGTKGVSLDNEIRKGLLLNDDAAAELSKSHADGGDISTTDAAKLAQRNSDALLDLIEKAQASEDKAAQGAVLRLMANTQTGNMLGVQSEDVAYLQKTMAMLAVPTAAAQTTVAENTSTEKATVLDRATTAFTDLGMKLSVAQKKADVVNRLASGENVTDSEINSLNPTNAKFRQVFTNLTGVQFPEKASIETYRNLYRSASSVSAPNTDASSFDYRSKAEDVQQNGVFTGDYAQNFEQSGLSYDQVNDVINQIIAGEVPAGDVADTVRSVLDGTYGQEEKAEMQKFVQENSQNPEVQEQAAQIYATVNGDLDQNGNRLATFKEFSDRYRVSVNPTATNTETAVQYQNYLEDSRTTRFNGQRLNYRSFSDLLRTAPGGSSLTDEDIRTLFDGAGKGDSDLADVVRSTAKQAAVKERTAKIDAVVTRMKSLLSGTGVKDIVIDTEGWAAPENNETARHNGYIENGVVHLNGNLVTTESAVYFTLGHELTHAAYDQQGKSILDNIIGAFQEMQKKGFLTGSLNTRVQNLEDTISRTKELYDTNDKSHTYSDDDIRQEVAGDLMSEVFGNKELMDRLAGVKPSILDRARGIVTSMLQKITGDNSSEAYRILKNLSDDFADALKGYDTYQTGETVVDKNGEPVGVSEKNGDMKLSLSTYEQSGRDLISKWVAKEVEANQLTQQDADDITDSLDSIYQTCRDYKNEFASFSTWSDAKVVSDENGKPAFSVVKSNGEYAMNLDFSTVCKKRRTLDAVLNKLVESGLADSFEFGQEDIVNINNIIKENGFEIACALCFVDSKRFRWAGDVDTFVTPYNELVRSLIPEGKNYKIDIFNFGGDTTITKATGKTLDTIPDSELDFTEIDTAIEENNDKTRIGKIARLLRSDPKQRCLLMRGDLLSSGGTGAMVSQNPALFETFNGSKGAGAAKASFADVQYQNEMIGQDEKTFDPEKAYSVGGVRIQSFSDYIPNMVFDYVQMLGDMTARKLPAHAYTKEFLFAAQFGLTGIKINLSLIPKVDAENTDAPAGLDADGNYLWADESFDFDLAVKIQNAEGYSKNCGSIAVGVSYEHIMKMMEDPNIRMIIPYHKSGINPIVAELNNIDRFEDFTNYQSTRYADSGKKLNKTDIKNDFLYNDYLHKNGDPRATAEQYVRWCEDHNYIPKFDQMKLKDGRIVSLAYLYKDGVAVEKDGKKVVNPNYYKVLEDFSVYDAVTDEYTPQGAVQMKFPDVNSAFGSMKDLIRQGLQENQDLEERRSEKVDGMVEQIKEVLQPVKRQSITARQDEEYQKAADSGDLETAQKLTDEAAKQSGFGVVAYHGTPTYGFNTFDSDRIGKNSGVGRGAFYFTSNQERAESYAAPSKTATASNMLANMNKVFQQYNSPELRKITGADDDAEGIEWDLDAISDYVHDRDYIDFNYDPDEYDSNSQYKKAEREVEDAGFKKYLTEQAEDLAKQSESIPSLKGFADDIRKAVEVPEAKPGVYKVYLYDAGKTKTYTADEDTYNDVAWKAASESKDLSEIHLNNGDTVYFTSNPANIKSADAVVRDDSGNIIPLSQRFDRTKNDIRYSITDNGMSYVKQITSHVERFTRLLLATPDDLQRGDSKVYNSTDKQNVKGADDGQRRYSLTAVSPVQPSENAEWGRGLTEQQISDLGYKLFGDVSQEEIDAMTPEEKEIYRKGHETQVKSTVSSYEKIFDGLKRQSPDNWQNLRVLDASSGLGYGTQAGRNAGFNVTDIEPYPSDTAYAGRKPDYTDYTKLVEQVKSGEVKPFDVIISNAVLNVLPQDTVDNLVSAMGELLAPGGKMYINVRDRGFLKDVLVSPKNRLLNYNGDIQTTTTSSGKTQAVLPAGLPAYDAYVAQTKTVQRGYTYNELASYLKDALGDGYTVDKAAFLGSAAAVVKKNISTQQTETGAGKRFSITPEFEQWYKDHYDAESVTDSQLQRRLQHQDEKIQAQKESEQAKLSDQNRAWEMYDQRTKRQQAKMAAESKQTALDQAHAEKVQALADLKEYLDAKAAVQHDADLMHEGRVKGQAVARLTQHEQDRVAQLKAHEQERVRLADRRARAVLQDYNRVNQIRQREAVVNGPVDTIRNSPERMAQVNNVQKEADRLRTLGRTAYATFFNNAQAIDDFAKKQDDGMAGILVNIVRGVNSTVDQIYTKGLVDRAGNQIGSSMKDTFLCMDGRNVDDNKQALLQDYLLHQHNIDRMGLVQKAIDRVTQFESENPDVAALDSKGLRLTIVEDTTNAVQAKKDFQARAIRYAKLLQTAAEVQNKPIFADKNGVAVTADTSRQIVAQYVKDNPWLAEKAKGIHEWWSQFMRTWAVGDSVTEDMYDMLEEMYPNYAPTYRVQGKGVGTANFVGANGATPGQAIKKAKGGLSEVVNIEDSYANLVQKTIKLARVNELYKSIVDSAMHDTEGKFSTMAVYDWENSGVSKQEVFGEDADEIEDKAIQSGLAQDRNGYTVSAWFNGKLERAYISKDLFNSLKATTTNETNGFTKLGAKITSPMKRAITGINPNFALRNISRDMPTAIINSISGLAFPKYWAQAAKEIASNSENWQHFQTLGGAQANYYNNENGFAKALSKNDNVKSKTLKAVSWFNEVTESQTRFAEYLATIDRLGGDTYENRLKGIKNAAEVTVDFGRHGTVGKAINAWVPYWNPSMQGIDKVVRSVVQTKDGKLLFSKAMSTLGRGAVTSILPEILMYAILKKDPDKYAEWAQLSDRTKDTYYCIPYGDHKFIKIPKNREWGSILGTPLMRILEGENGRSDPFANYVEDALIPNFLPNQIIGFEDGRVTSDIIGLSQGLELNANKDFAGRTIVPYSYQQGSLSQQKDADTSWYAKKLGEMLDLSPMQIDYVMKSYFGDFASMMQKATSDATWGGDEPAVKEISNGVLSVITKPWVADSRYSNQNVSDYYEMIDNLGRVVQDKRNQMGTDAAQTTTEYKTEKALEKLYGSQITDLNKQASTMPDGEEKDAIKQQIVDLSQNALKYYDDCMSGDIKEPLLDATYSDFSSDVSSELIRMDGYSDEYKFKPTGTPSAKYTDPDNKKREYVLDDTEKEHFKDIYNEQYNESASRLIATAQYRNSKDDKKAQLLEDLRDDVLDSTKDEFFRWLRKQGIRSTVKK